MVLEGFRRGMGTAFSSGKGDHLPPMRVDTTPFVPETQADVLRNELTVELVDHDAGVWESGAEEGLVRVEKPTEGQMVKIRATGQVVVYVNSKGELVVDNKF